MSKKPRKIKIKKPGPSGKHTLVLSEKFVTVEAVGKMYEEILKEIERRGRLAELRAVMNNSAISHEHTVTRANLIVLQTMLWEKNIIDREEFIGEYTDYMENHIGIVENGSMNGNVAVFTYNVGEKIIPTSVPEEHTGIGPVVIIQQ